MFWDKWRHRITGAWQVLTGQAFAAYYFDDCMQKYWRPEGIKLPPGGGPLTVANGIVYSNGGDGTFDESDNLPDTNGDGK